MRLLLHYFIDSNSPVPVSYFYSNFGDCSHLFRLSGFPHGTLRELLETAAAVVERKGCEVHMIHSCLDDSPQGLLVPELSTGVYSFDAWSGSQPNILGYLGCTALAEVREKIGDARRMFYKARAFHDQQEKIYLSQMDFEKADALAQSILERLLPPQAKKEEPGRVFNRFFGAATCWGNVNHVPEVMDDFARRFYIKGRPGTGKSTFLKKLAGAAANLGYDTECYHCALDPGSLDLVAVRELGFCLLDSTSPHEFFPTRPGDEILDFYRECVTPGTDEAYEKELFELRCAYKELVGRAGESLLQAKTAADRFEASLPPLDTEGIKELQGEIIKALLAGSSQS